MFVPAAVDIAGEANPANANSQTEASVASETSVQSAVETGEPTDESNLDVRGEDTASAQANASNSAKLGDEASPQGNVPADVASRINERSEMKPTCDDSWRYRDFQGRRWYWRGERGNGYWTYLSNGRWIRFQGNTTTASNTGNISAQSRARVSGYRGSTSQSFDSPYYSDNQGRRYFMNNNSYLLDSVWNARFWNEDFGRRSQQFLKNNGPIYNRMCTLSGSVAVNGGLQTPAGSGNLGVRVLNQNGAFNGSVRGSANVGQRIGEALGGSAGGNVGAAIGPRQ